VTMFDFSFAELLLVIVVAVVFIQPKDLPVLIKAIAKVMKTLRDFSHEVKQTFDDIAKETGISDVKETLDAEMRLIKGDDGKMYESYHISPLEKNVKKHDYKEE
jgi:Tat protein translocase TatB subunit